ncbi:FmdB family zinc ribbon protein [Halopseudomonas phragmitis]|uniref:Formamidase n=1 Tax=Halopseudomonas phragmitis TaxID=1931241 RepID=A0A1V0B926_9GAMM|nr:FmdB family zinc ribbon protein [Halopseudomonas phragmitis]AQZ96439.1 formamidase [Halopseudomonas phragmitis]
MPLYDYKCQEHGIFHALATMDEFDKPQPCPQCGVMSAKVILLPSHLFKVDDSERKAKDRNEKAMHSPILSTPEYRAEEQARHEHKHGKGCGCAHQKLGKSKLFWTANGEKMFPSARPWMISH